MRRIGHISNIKEMLSREKKKVIILGAYDTGKFVCKKLIENHIDVCMFFDEDIEKVGKKYYSVQVSNSRDWVKDKDYVAILCINSIARYDDSAILKSDFIQRLSIKEDCLIVFDRVIGIWDTLKKMFNECDIDITGQYIKIGETTWPNYLNMEDEVRKIFIEECGDLILPQFFGVYDEVNEGPYEDKDFFLNNNEKNVVIDLGANIGIYTAIMASNPHNVVYAFEPNLQAINILQEVNKIYNNIHVVPYAVSNRSGISRMTDSAYLDQNKLIGQLSDGVEVALTTIDDFVKKENLTRIDFIKADIEGAERDMLSGCKDTLQKFSPMLSLCTYHRDDDPEVLENMIKNINPDYRVRHSYKKIFAHVPL